MGRNIGSKFILGLIIGLSLFALLVNVFPDAIEALGRMGRDDGPAVATATATSAPSPSPEPTDEPTLVPTEAPTPTPTNTPAPTPIHTPAAEPTVIATHRECGEPCLPDPEPTPTDTPEPTSTPTEVPTSEPTVIPTATQPPTCKEMGAECPNRNSESAALPPQTPSLPAVDSTWKVIDAVTNMPVSGAELRLTWNRADWKSAWSDEYGQAKIALMEAPNMGEYGGGVYVFHPDYLLSAVGFTFNEEAGQFDLFPRTTGITQDDVIYLYPGSKFVEVFDPSPIDYAYTFIWPECGKSAACAEQLARTSFLTDPNLPIICERYEGLFSGDRLVWYRVDDYVDAHARGEGIIEGHQCTQVNGVILWIEDECGNIVTQLPANWHKGEGPTFYIGES